VQLTRGGGGIWPCFSPDGRWVYYTSATSSESWGPVWKVPLEGGEPVLVVDKLAGLPDVSPDGKLLAYFYWDPLAKPVRGIAVAPAEGGEPVKRFGVIYPANLRWTPDGRSLAYLDERFVNVVAQPIDGGPPRQLTDFKFGDTLWFEWSRDGRTLALARGSLTSDAVLITDFR
jgi:Tol biopolymer transport system component